MSFGSHYSLDASAEDGLASVTRIKIKAPKQVSVGSPKLHDPITNTAEAREYYQRAWRKEKGQFRDS
jgi:hypothetical protein